VRRAGLGSALVAAFVGALWIPAWVRNRRVPTELTDLLRRYPALRVDRAGPVDGTELQKRHPDVPSRSGVVVDLTFARRDFPEFIAFHRDLKSDAGLNARFPVIAYDPIGDLNGDPARFHLYLLEREE
jgi:hypothetical protein